MKNTFTKKELIDFGNYLLSKERYELYKNHPVLGPLNLSARLSQVSDADFQNFFEHEKNAN